MCSKNRSAMQTSHSHLDDSYSHKFSSQILFCYLDHCSHLKNKKHIEIRAIFNFFHSIHTPNNICLFRWPVFIWNATFHSYYIKMYEIQNFFPSLWLIIRIDIVIKEWKKKKKNHMKIIIKKNVLMWVCTMGPCCWPKCWSCSLFLTWSEPFASEIRN